MKRSRTVAVTAMGLVLAAWGVVSADIIVPGADGSDGAFSPVANTTVNLANSPDGTWNGVNPDPGTPLTGVYDGDKWAVVFRYSSVNIPSNVTVTFTNHPKRAPVVWLVDGSVTINGVVSLNGSAGHGTGGSPLPSAPGPGGFRGGRGNAGLSSPSSGGFGPGGTSNTGSGNTPPGGSYATLGTGGGGGPSSVGPLYGNASILPLIGGSGAGAVQTTFGTSATAFAGSGAGGGAILIVARQTITIGSGAWIGASGGNGGATAYGSGGSGGAIRLVGDTVTGVGTLYAVGGSPSFQGGTGGVGRIRVETNNASTLTGTPNPSFSTVGSTALIWPDSAAPTIKITVLDGNAVPLDPIASLDFPSADLNITNPNPMVLQLDTTNVPPTSTVKVRVVPKSGTSCLAGMGSDCTYLATHVSGDTTASIWSATIRVPDGFSALQAHAVLP